MRGCVCAVMRPHRLTSGLLAALLVAHSSRFAGEALAELDKLQTQQYFASGSAIPSWHTRTDRPTSSASRSSGGSGAGSSGSRGAVGLATLAALPRPVAGADPSTADATANLTPLHQKGEMRAFRRVRASADDAVISNDPKAGEGSSAGTAGSPNSDRGITGSISREIGDRDSPDTSSSATASSGPGRRDRALQAASRTDAHSADPYGPETGSRDGDATQLGSSDSAELPADEAATSGSVGSGSVGRRPRKGAQQQQLQALGEAPQSQAEPKGDSRQADSPDHIVGGLPARRAMLLARSNINFIDSMRCEVLQRQQYIRDPTIPRPALALYVKIWWPRAVFFLRMRHMVSWLDR